MECQDSLETDFKTEESIYAEWLVREKGLATLNQSVDPDAANSDGCAEACSQSPPVQVRRHKQRSTEEASQTPPEATLSDSDGPSASSPVVIPMEVTLPGSPNCSPRLAACSNSAPSSPPPGRHSPRPRHGPPGGGGPSDDEDSDSSGPQEPPRRFTPPPDDSPSSDHSSPSDPDSGSEPDSDQDADRTLVRSFLYDDGNLQSQLSRSEAILLVSALRLHRSVSAALMADVNLLCDAMLPATGLGIGQSAVADFEETVLAPYDLAIQRHCIVCAGPILNEVAECTEPRCVRQWRTIRTTKDSRYTVIAHCSIRKQLERIARAHVEQLVRVRDAMLAPEPDTKKELWDWLDYRVNRLVESPDHLSITLLLNTDGFPVKGNYKGSCWPVFLQVAELPRTVRSLYANGVIGAFYMGMAKPTQEDWTRLLTPMLDELRDIEAQGGFAIEGFTVEVSVKYVVTDLDGCATLFNMKTWAGEYACSLCEIRGANLRTVTGDPRATRVFVWPLDMEGRERTNDRVERSIAAAVRRGRTTKGIHGAATINRLIYCNRRFPDALHLFGEGLFKDLLKRFLSTPALYPKYSLLNHLPEIDKAVNSTILPTRWTGRFRALSSLSQGTYSEKLMMGVFIFPILALESFVPDPATGLVVVLLAMLVRLLLMPTLSPETRRVIRALTDLLRPLYDHVIGPRFSSLKVHQILAHVAHLVNVLGTPFDLDTASFESYNFLFRYALPVKQTRGVPESMLRKSVMVHIYLFLLQREIIPRFLDMAARSDIPALQSLQLRWRNQGDAAPPATELLRDRFGVAVPVRCSVSSNDARVVTFAAGYLPLDRCRVFSRVRLPNGSPFSSCLWRHAAKSCQFDVAFLDAPDNPSPRFGRVLFYFMTDEMDRNVVYALLTPYSSTSSRLVSLARSAARTLPDRLRHDVRAFVPLLQRHDSWRLFTGEDVQEVIEARQIVGYCAIVTLLHRDYIIDLRMKQIHE